MDGKPFPQAPDGAHSDATYNPPSLTEPVAAPAVQVAPAGPSPAVAVLPQPVVPSQPAPVQPPAETVPTTPAAGFYHAEAEPQPPAEITAYDDQASQESDSQTDTEPNAPATVLSWIGSGEALQESTAAWRIKMTALSVVLGLVVLLITRDWAPALSVTVAGLLFSILGSRRPQDLAYRLDARGISVGQKYHTYTEFRAFSIADDATPPSIELAPLKRFAPTMSLLLDPELSEQIVAMLSQHLPMEAHTRDVADRLIGFLGK